MGPEIKRTWAKKQDILLSAVMLRFFGEQGRHHEL